MTIKSVLIAGAGAVGLTVADTLAAYSESEVRVLAGGSRLERYRREGLTVTGRKLPIQMAPAGIPADSFEPELIIVACKFHHLNQILTKMFSQLIISHHLHQKLSKNLQMMHFLHLKIII